MVCSSYGVFYGMLRFDTRIYRDSVFLYEGVYFSSALTNRWGSPAFRTLRLGALAAG